MKVRLLRTIQVRLLVPLLLAAFSLAGCVGVSGELAEDDVIEGTLSNIACADGQLTVVTKEGKTFVLTISTPDCEAKNLQTGSTVRVTTAEDRRTVQNITVVQKTEVKQTVVVGKIVAVEREEVTVQKDTGERVKVKVKSDTKGAENLRPNVNVVINIDQTTNVAQTVIIQGSGTPQPQGTSTPQPTLTPESTPRSTPTGY